MQGAQSAYILETELEWLVYQLWTKNTARAPTFSFSLADTVILRQGSPQTWYFSSKEGYILKKNYQNVKLAKINKHFNKKNGMSLNSSMDLPAASTYLYKAQRNSETGQERMQLRMGYIAGKDLHGFMRACANNNVEEGRPHILQAFVPPRLVKNSIIKVTWSSKSIELLKISNKLPIIDQRYSLQTRVVTAEDEQDGLYTEQAVMPNSGHTYENIFKAMIEIQDHIKKNSDINLTRGNFFFKMDEKDRPVLLFATQLKTERPILVLNSSVNMVLCFLEYAIPNHGTPQTADSEVQTPLNYRQTSLVSVNEKYKRQDISLPELNRMENINGLFGENQKSKKQQITASSMTNTGSKRILSLKQSSEKLKPRIMSALPPKSQASGGIKSSDSCPFCIDKLTIKEQCFEMTVNQIIKMYEYFEQSPSGLLLLPATSSRQQKFFEDIYAQVAFKMTKLPSNLSGSSSRRNSFSSAQAGAAQIPLPLQKAFDLVSLSKYTMLKNDPSFIYRTLKICHLCYESVKAMLVHQSKEQIKQKSSAGQLSEQVSQSNTNRFPKNASTVSQPTDKMLIQEQLKTEKTPTLSESEIRSIVDPTRENEALVQAQIKSMFMKVQGGKEICQSDDDPSAQSNFLSEKSPSHDKALSLDIKTTISVQLQKNEDIHVSQVQNKMIKQQNIKNSTVELNDNIISFVKRNGLPTAEIPQQKSSGRKWSKPASGKLCPTRFNLNEKRELRQARKNLNHPEMQGHQRLESAQNIFDQHRILVPQRQNITISQQQNNYFYGNGPISQKSLANPQSSIITNPPHMKKMRPISANTVFTAPLTQLQSDFVDQSPFFKNLSLQQQSEYAVIGGQKPPAYLQILDSQEVVGVPQVFTKYDAARIYLNSVNKNDVDLQKQMKTPKVRIKSKMTGVGAKPPLTKAVIFPKQPRTKSKEQRKDIYSMTKLTTYPQTMVEHKNTHRNDQNGHPQGQLQRDSINMFNYSSANSRAGIQPTNIVVPQGKQMQKQETQSAQPALAASLLNLQEMEMQDIDQIAANADNLIQILQTIKQAKQTNLEGKRGEQQVMDGSKQTPNFPTAAVSSGVRTSIIHPQTTDQHQNNEKDEFWDNHSHSPLHQSKPAINENKSSRVDDLWDDNALVREGPLEDSISMPEMQVDEIQAPTTDDNKKDDFWNSPKKTDVGKESEPSSKQPKDGDEGQKKTRNTEFNKLKIKEQPLQAVVAKKSVTNLNLELDKSNQILLADARGIKQRQSQQQQSMRQISSIDAGSSQELTSRITRPQKIVQNDRYKRNGRDSVDIQTQATRKFVQDQPNISEGRQNNDDVLDLHQPSKTKPLQVYSVVREASLEQSASLEEQNFPSHLMEQISQIVEKRVLEELRKSKEQPLQFPDGKLHPEYDLAKSMAAESSIREDLISEAFNTYGRQQPLDLDSYQNQEVARISQISDMSPVPLAVNPKAKGITSVDNKFDTNADPIPMTAANLANDITEDYSQHYSSIQRDEQHNLQESYIPDPFVESRPDQGAEAVIIQDSTVYTAVEESLVQDQSSSMIDQEQEEIDESYASQRTDGRLQKTVQQKTTQFTVY